METVENEDSPLLDPSLAPALLFDVEPGDDDDDDATRSCLLYSIPKKRALQLPATAATGFGFGRFVADRHWVTPQGWVLTLTLGPGGSRDVSLRDPFSSRTVHLPPDPEGLLDSQNTRCLLSTTTTTTHRPRTADDAEYPVVVLVVHRKLPVLYFCRPGGARWFRHEYDTTKIIDDDEDRDSSISSSVLTMERLTAVGGGRFVGHILADEKVVTLDFSSSSSSSSSSPTLTVTQAANSPSPVSCFQVRSWKVESCGEVFMVKFCYTTVLCRHKRVARVHVDRLDWSRNAWVRVKAAAGGLGPDRAFC